MSALQIVALVVCLAVALTGIALFARVIRQFLAVFRLGQPDATRTGDKGARTVTLLREFLGHTRMSRLPVVAVAHWFTMISFGVLFFTLLNAFGQLVKADFALPLIGHFFLYEWVTEFFAWTGLVGIVDADGDPAEEPPALGSRRGRSAVALLRVELLAGLLRRADHPRRHDLHPQPAGAGVRARLQRRHHRLHRRRVTPTRCTTR